jgi:predicted nucleotidyltransferase
MESNRSLLDLVGLEQNLKDLLRRDVDVVTEASIHPDLRPRITAGARAL